MRSGVGKLSSSASEPPESSRWKKPAAFWTAVLGAVAAVAQLGVFSPRVSRTLLYAVVLSALGHLAVWLWQFYYVQRVRQLRGELTRTAQALTDAEISHQHYVRAIERITDREKPLFSETLEVTVVVGSDDASDRIIEKRVTTPEPLVTNRTMRPIAPTDDERIVRLNGIEFTARRSDGGEITTLPLREQINKLRVWLVFDPALSVETEWSVEYRPRGLWRPLRERGWDKLAWDDRLLKVNGTTSAFSRFVVVFRFPASDQAPGVLERQGLGELEDPKQATDGTWTVVWCDAEPAGRYYVWDLTRPPNALG